MDTYNAPHFLDTEFPALHRAKLPSALETAYKAVDEMYKNEPLLDVRSAQIGKGHVIAWAVDKQVERLLETGALPYDFQWVNFEKPTGQYLQIRLGSSTMSINQLKFPTETPRHARFRHNKILNNQPFLDIPEVMEENRVTGLPHLTLGHGYQELNFAQIGILHPQAEHFGWIHRTGNLMDMPHIVDSDLPPVEATDAEAIVTLKEEINKWVRDNHE